MQARGPVCPHPGCEGQVRAGSNFCPRCGRPVNTDAAYAGQSGFGATIGWLFVAVLASFFCLPCFFSSLGHPIGFVFLAPPVVLFWQAFKKPPPGKPQS